MTYNVIRMTDPSNRLGDIKMTQSERSRTLMAMRQSEALLYLLHAAYSHARHGLALAGRWSLRALGERVVSPSLLHAQSGTAKRVRRGQSPQE
jgi:hypothetical protein